MSVNNPCQFLLLLFSHSTLVPLNSFSWGQGNVQGWAPTSFPTQMMLSPVQCHTPVVTVLPLFVAADPHCCVLMSGISLKQKTKDKMLEEVVHRQTELFSPERQLGHLLVSSVWRRKGPQPEHLGTQRGTTRSRSYKGTLSNSEKLERGTENLRAQTQTGAQNKAVVLWWK